MTKSNSSEADVKFMQRALELAKLAGQREEVPVGAVLVREGVIIGEGYNQTIGAHDATAHAEIVALRDAGSGEKNYRLPGSTLYVTLEPCSMCAGAIVHARVERVVYAALEPRAGAAVSQQRFFESEFLNHRVTWEQGPLSSESSALIQAFFRNRR